MRRKTHTSNPVCWRPPTVPQSSRLDHLKCHWDRGGKSFPSEGKTGEGADLEGSLLLIPQRALIFLFQTEQIISCLDSSCKITY